MHQLADGQALRMWRDESCDAMLYLSVCGDMCRHCRVCALQSNEDDLFITNKH